MKNLSSGRHVIRAFVASAIALSVTVHLAHADAADVAVADGDALAEVEVTATRVQQNLQQTPISISSLSGEQLQQDNVFEIADLRGLVPNLEVVQQSGGGAGSYGTNQTAFYIRGIGSESRFFSSQPGVGVYVDDVYMSTSQNLNLSFYDLGDAQVLKGPQGTLFGKNTLGGAVLLETAAPSPEFGGYGQVSFGNFNRVDTQGGINIPFTDTLYSRLSFFSSDVDGYITHALDSGRNDDVNEKSVRYQVQYKPNSDFTADLLTEYGASHDNGFEAITIACNPAASYIKNYDSVHTVPYCSQYAPLGQPFEVYGNATAQFPQVAGGPTEAGTGGFTPFDRGRSGTTNLRLSWHVDDDLTLKSISAYKYSSLDSYRDDGTPGGLYTELMNYNNQQLSEELQALSSLWNGRINFIGGLFYLSQKAHSEQNTGPDYVDPVGYFYGNQIQNTSFAAYLHATVKIIDGLSATVGVRYSHDKTDTASSVWQGCTGTYLQEYQTGTGGCWIPGPTANDWASATGTWSHTDPSFQLNYQWTPEVLTYVSASSGYEAGGFNAQPPYLGAQYNLPYAQETVWNFEAGIKSEWFEHRLRLDIAGFDQEFHNYQSSVVQYYNGVDVHTTNSAANAYERGTELELDAIPVPDLSVRLTFAYLSQGYSKIFPGAQGLTLQTAISTAPKDQTSLSVDYTVHLKGGARLVPSLNYRLQGTRVTGTFPEQYEVPGYGLLGGNLRFVPASGRWEASAWVRNLTNKYYYNDYASGLNTDIGITQVVPGEPREYGVTLKYSLGN